jgi:hypothetical protein
METKDSWLERNKLERGREGDRGRVGGREGETDREVRVREREREKSWVILVTHQH